MKFRKKFHLELTAHTPRYYPCLLLFSYTVAVAHEKIKQLNQNIIVISDHLLGCHYFCKFGLDSHITGVSAKRF